MPSFVASTIQLIAKFDFGWGSAPVWGRPAPQTPLGELIQLPLPAPYLDFRGPTSNGGEGREREGGKKRRGSE